jgi:hypothetical protein
MKNATFLSFTHTTDPASPCGTLLNTITGSLRTGNKFFAKDLVQEFSNIHNLSIGRIDLHSTQLAYKKSCVIIVVTLYETCN